MLLKKKIFEYFFYDSNLGLSGAGPFCTPGPFHLNKFGRDPTRQCYILNFKHLSKVVLQKIFIFFSIYFYGLNIGPPGAGPSCTQEPSFEQTWLRTTRQCYIPNFKHLSQVVPKKKVFEYFSMYFYGLNLGSLGKEPC